METRADGAHTHLVEQLHPGFHDCIERVKRSLAAHHTRLLCLAQGSNYGFAKDCRDMARSQVPVRTKVANLLLTGQNINLHGFCGVPLTAITTAEAIVARTP